MEPREPIRIEGLDGMRGVSTERGQALERIVLGITDDLEGAGSEGTGGDPTARGQVQERKVKAGVDALRAAGPEGIVSGAEEILRQNLEEPESGTQ